MENTEIPIIKCAYGCGNLIPKFYKEKDRVRKDKERRYDIGHQNYEYSKRFLGENKEWKKICPIKLKNGTE
jgi:hypothetical protein